MKRLSFPTSALLVKGMTEIGRGVGLGFIIVTGEIVTCLVAVDNMLLPALSSSFPRVFDCRNSLLLC